MHVGVDNFVSAITDPATGQVVGPEERMQDLLDEIVLADQSGVHAFGIGEHHRPEFYDSAPVVVLAAAAARTTRIRLASAVLVLSAADPVRVFQEFSTLDLIAHGRTDLVVGRGSFTEAYPLFGLDLRDYASLFEEKLDLLLRLRASEKVTWSGRHRPELVDQGVYPRPVQHPLPVWVGVGGTPESFVRAGLLGLPLVVAIIGGEPARFRPLVDLYRRAGAEAGHAPETLRVGLHLPGFVDHTSAAARDAFFPGWFEMMGRIGRERGFAPPNRAQFEQQAGPEGAFVIGDPGTVAGKLTRIAASLGGVERISLQMTNPQTSHTSLMRSIELLGSTVVPAVVGA
jgi:probable LLM family oxidoreductase